MPSRKRQAPLSPEESNLQPPQRERFTGAEEKRQLILAHAARRPVIDPMQKVTLWAGVAVCTLAIGAGWIYTMRQTMAFMFVGSVDKVKSELTSKSDVVDPSNSLSNNLNDAISHLKQIQDQSSVEIRTEQALVEKLNASSTVGTVSSAVQAKDDSVKTGKKDFKMPPGISQDTKNKQ